MPSPISQRLTEAWSALLDTLVDPHEPFLDDASAAWLPLASDAAPGDMTIPSAAQLQETRNHCRMLALTNEFAINGHENRINFIVGPGHSYRVTAVRGQQPARTLLLDAMQELNRFLRENQWPLRQAEIVRRRDRDGEVFLRFFTSPAGVLQLRFVEPAAVATPPRYAAQPGVRLGIMTLPQDVETVQAYLIDGSIVPADEIQHRKLGVDANVLRGMPLFYPVRKNLRRAEKLLRNMSTVAEIQSAIALIRKHRAAGRGGVEAFVAGQADATAPNMGSGGGARSRTWQHFSPGTILDAPGSIEYEFPAAQLNAGSYVAILQAELRAIASRLVMPEFMLTSDASNANYSSTMIAEGPAMRMFARLQAEQVAADQVVLEKALQTAITAGRLPRDTLELCEITAVPPSLAVRDQLQETQRRRIEYQSGILSAQTWSQQTGLDYDQEQALRKAHAAI
ncbi:MAG: phage portal protein [Pirellulales bacterium]|nr:phage portal protein [Pirellulales bacterium]